MSSPAPDPNHSADRVLIAGGGIGGSLLALVLARQGIPVTVIDPKGRPAPSFRNEKLGEEQAEALKALGVLDVFARVCCPPPGHPNAYECNPRLTDCGVHHHDWVASVRAAWPDTVRFVEASVASFETSDSEQTLITGTGERHTGRLAVLATGRVSNLHKELGIDAKVVSPAHSVTLGFTLQGAHHVPSAVFQPVKGSRIGYISLFPIASPAGARLTRVNIFSFRALDDAWTRRMSRDPVGGLAEIAPDAAAVLAGLELKGRCELRGTDLYKIRHHQRPGLVLLGDAFHAPCPSSGTGLLRVLYDVRVLNAQVANWLTTPGMGLDKIARFYNDPAKRWIDKSALQRSLRSRRAALMSTPVSALLNLLRALRSRLGLDAATRLSRLERRLQGVSGQH